MNRRDFIATLGAAAAAAMLAPLEKLAPAEREAWLDETMHVGDVFQIEGLYAVNPVTGTQTAHLQQFVVTGVHGPDLTIHPSINGVIGLHQRHVKPLGTKDR